MVISNLFLKSKNVERGRGIGDILESFENKQFIKDLHDHGGDFW